MSTAVVATRQAKIMWQPPDPGQEKAAGLAPDAAFKTTQKIHSSTRPDAPGARRSDDRARGIAEHYRALADARDGPGEPSHVSDGTLRGRR